MNPFIGVDDRVSVLNFVHSHHAGVAQDLLDQTFMVVAFEKCVAICYEDRYARVFADHINHGISILEKRQFNGSTS